MAGLDNSKLEVSGPIKPRGRLTLRSPPPPPIHSSPHPHCPLPPHFVLQAIAHEIYAELVEDACLGLCFEVHRAVKCGYFFLDDTDPDSMKDFGEGERVGGDNRTNLWGGT